MQLEVAAAGRRGLPYLAIENYSQIQAKKEAPEGAPENRGFFARFVIPADAGTQPYCVACEVLVENRRKAGSLGSRLRGNDEERVQSSPAGFDWSWM